MLPKIEMVKKALSSLHTSTCIIHTYSNGAMDENTGIVDDVETASDPIPCRLSFNSSPTTDGEGIAQAAQTATLFLDPSIVVIAGSDIDVIQNGRTMEFTAAGVPEVYQGHQEINLVDRVKYHG
ncbi:MULTISPECIES: hypothetical protein [Megasphaera]|uniref:Uncharacterized protein n=1 Tax=Megasphaera vaginalis (ex Srinivasan et al. 2021) TaxID=1111454 RepID=U7US28_9FIRM|nr:MULTISPECIES: hypothetical protein [Megasphaera]ERT61263.1 hypothetical protein HMPREF1250_0172 [Megasphaera vaginalis (ex Srinivasan et al. 2021)]